MTLRKIIILISLCFCSSGLIFGFDTPAADLGITSTSFDVEQLRELLTRTVTTNIDHVIEALPEAFRRNFALAYNSRSTTSTSFDLPRILLTNSDASLLVAFSGDSKDQRFEVIYYDKNVKEFNFGLLKELDGRIHLDNSAATQSTCLKCHDGLSGKVRDARSKPLLGLMRPVWDNYRIWSGFYGSTHNDKNPSVTEVERNYFSDFKQKVGGRYDSLPGLNDITIEDLGIRNAGFTQVIYQLNFERLLSRVLQTLKERPSLIGLWMSALDKNLSTHEYIKRIALVTGENHLAIEKDFKALGFDSLITSHGTVRFNRTSDRQKAMLLRQLKLEKQIAAESLSFLDFNANLVKPVAHIGYFISKFLEINIGDSMLAFDRTTLQFARSRTQIDEFFYYKTRMALEADIKWNTFFRMNPRPKSIDLFIESQKLYDKKPSGIKAFCQRVFSR